MYRKLLLAAVLVFSCITLRDIAPPDRSSLPTPAFNFTKANYPGKTTGIPFWETGKKDSVVDTAALKQGNWYATVIKNIEASEYEIKKDDKTGSYCGPNRQQQLRAFFNYNSFTLQPRSEEKGWTLRMQLSGIYANKQLVAKPGENDLPVIGSNKIIFNNADFSTEYINSKEGIRQNFIIQKEPASKPACPAGRPQTLNIKLQTDKGWYINKVHDKELHFAKHEGDQLNNKITYNSLKVWDANNKELAARFLVNKKHAGFDIEVNTSNAVYPITIDPLSTTPNSILDDCDQANANFGISVASAGDVNGDGYSDVIIGAYSFDDGFTDEGKAFVYHGSATGLSATPNSTPDDADQAGANFGYCVASAGDVNGDGYSDIIIGAFSFDEGFTDEGKAFVYHGSAAGLSATPNSTPDDADQAFAQVGISVASAGDVNGDGFSDVMIGARLYDDGFSDEGKVFVYHGSATGLSATPNSTPDDADQLNAYFGFSIASAGDINGDGYSDVIIGAYSFDDGFTDEGKAFVYHGSAAGLSATPNSTPDDADQVFAYFGFSVASAGDVNADGYSDVIIGAYQYNDSGNTDEGRAFVYYGSVTGLSATPNSTPDDADQAFAQFGISVTSAGDVNGDGYSDVIIGANGFNDGANTDEGRTFVYNGSPGKLNTTEQVQLDNSQNNAQMGYSVACAGDVNGDGYSDVIIGARYFTNGQQEEGAVFIYHGSTTGVSNVVQTQLEVNVAYANLGTSVSCAGDVNGDGYSDVVVSSAQAINGGCAAFVYHGSSTGITTTVQTQITNGFGSWIVSISVASAGDVNGDGYSDIIIGSFYYENGQNQEGGAFIYHGSAAGISTTIQTQLEINQAYAHFGCSVAGAGDVNGDGYGDVIVGAFWYDNGQSDEGAAFVYHGSSTGITTTIRVQLEGNQTLAQMGGSVSSAGDVNGDGYSDAIVGASNLDAAYVFHGSATGITTTIQAQLNGQPSSQMGVSVASAGDVNGDGYSDVIVGAMSFSNGQSSEGGAFVFHGSAAGITTTIQTQLEWNQASAQIGRALASAGDVNGDGYSDVIVGVPYFKAGFVYLGNNGGGLRNNLRLYNLDLLTPIQQLNITEPNLFGAGLFSKSALGRVKGKLVWEVKSESGKFSGNPITNSTAYLDKQTSFTDLGTAGTELKSQVQKVGSKSNKIRTRVEYDKVTAITGQVYGPWRYPPGYTQGAYGMNSVPLPVKLNGFSAALIEGKVKLHWSTADDENVRTYQVERSADNMNFTSTGTVSSLHQNNKTYTFTDNHPLKGRSWYRLRVMDEYNRIGFSNTVLIKNTKDAVLVYPTIIGKGETVNLLFNNNISGNVELLLVNGNGTLVFRKTISASGSNNYPIVLSSLPTGVYILSVINKGETVVTQKIIAR